MLDICVIVVCAHDFLDVLNAQRVLILPFREVLLSIDNEHLTLPILRLVLIEDKNGCRNASAIEELWWQGDHRFDEIVLEDEFTDTAFCATTEEDAVR